MPKLLVRNLTLFLVTTVVAAMPLRGVCAADLRIPLNTPDAQFVSRGEFVRAAVKALGLPISRQTLRVKDARRIPVGLAPYIREAEEHHAIDHFGRALALGRPITRGDALIVLMKLADAVPSGSAKTFSDIPRGSELEDAVTLAIERDWMKSASEEAFGVRDNLTGREGRLLLSRVARASTRPEPSPTPPVRLRVPTPSAGASVELPKGEVLRNVWKLLHDEFLYKERIKPDEAGYKAIEAIINTLQDPHTVFFRPVGTQNFRTQIQGEVSGIGAQVEVKDGFLTIVAPLKGSPAEKAGILAGDQILSVNDTSVTGMPLDEAVSLIRGPKGSKVRLRIKRVGNELDVSVVRDVIRIPEVEVSWQGNIAVLKLYQFGATTDRELRGVLAQVQERSPKGLVIDLRNNPGGLLHAAEIVLSNVLPKGSVIAHIVGRDIKEDVVTKDEPTIAQNVKIIVIVNKGSASASEIVAGALQDSGRAVVLGETTYGKGSVQQIAPLPDGSSLKMTIAEYTTPDGKKVDGVGITPNIAVAMPEPGARDEPMSKALDLLR